MKKIILIGLCLAFLFPSVLSAQSVVKLTRYNGDKITGISAASAFDVYLEQSKETKVVVEIAQELENLLVLNLGSDGIVRVSLQSNNRSRQSKNPVMKITVYLPELTYIRGSGATTFYSSGNFSSRSTEMEFSGASDLKSLNLNAEKLKATCSGASDIKLNGDIANLDLRLSGASDANVNVQSTTAKIQCSGASDLKMTGAAREAEITVSGGSDANLSGFTVRKATVNASGASDVSVWAVDSLDATASSASTIRYKGNPEAYNAQSKSSGGIRKIK